MGPPAGRGRRLRRFGRTRGAEAITGARGAPIPVRLLWLHVRSRALGTQGATVVVVATLSLLLHARVRGGLAARTTALALPLLPSLIVGTCFHAPARQVGRTVPASTPLLELVHATAYAVASGLALAAPATLVGSSGRRRSRSTCWATWPVFAVWRSSPPPCSIRAMPGRARWSTGSRSCCPWRRTPTAFKTSPLTRGSGRSCPRRCRPQPRASLPCSSLAPRSSRPSASAPTAGGVARRVGTTADG